MAPVFSVFSLRDKRAVGAIGAPREDIVTSIRTTAVHFALAVPLAIAAAPAGAQSIDDVAKAMGVGKAETLHYVGAGMVWNVGQSFRPGEAWPRFNMVRGTRAFDLKQDVFITDIVVTQAENPIRGGALQPVIGEQRRASGIAGDKAWIVAGAFTLATTRFQPTLKHDYWTSPHAVVKAALADKAKLSPAEGGAMFEVARAGQWKARVFVGKTNLVERVESWVDSPVLGDMAVVTSYGDYKDFAGVMAPTRVRQSAGGHPILDMTVSQVKVNVGAVAAPAASGSWRAPRITASPSRCATT